MNFKAVTSSDEMWNQVRDYAYSCSWRAGKSLANAMDNYLFVGEEYRGNRLSQKLMQYAMHYLKTVGFDRVHLVTDHENLYEKYGFEVIDRKIAPWRSVEKIYVRRLSD